MSDTEKGAMFWKGYAQQTVEENDALRAEVERLEHRRRWNVEEYPDGSIGVCRQLHEKYEGCEYERYVPVAKVERLRAALRRWQHYGCPDCGGDCSAANPPIACCIMRETDAALEKK